MSTPTDADRDGSRLINRPARHDDLFADDPCFAAGSGSRRPQTGSRGARRCRLLARLDIAGRLGDLRRDRPLRPSQRRRRSIKRSLFDAAFEPSRPARRDYSFKPFGAFAARLLPPAGRPCRASGRPSLEAPQSRIRLTPASGRWICCIAPPVARLPRSIAAKPASWNSAATSAFASASSELAARSSKSWRRLRWRA